jgi:hypothetical protein
MHVVCQPRARRHARWLLLLPPKLDLAMLMRVVLAGGAG